MDIISNLSLGISQALIPTNIWFCFIGVLLGTLVGVLPGLGPTATMAILLPMTLTLPPDAALIMMAGIYYGAQYGGSTTAILINLPGEASSTVTAIDGYKMALKGRGGPALVIAAGGSFFAGCVATLVIAVLAEPLAQVALEFSATDYTSLIVLGLIASVSLARGSLLKALAMVALGLTLGLVGTDVYTGSARFTFGLPGLADGLDIVALAVGLFGVSEVLRNLEAEHTDSVEPRKIEGLMPNREEMRQSVGPVLRGTGLGSILGVLPGAGALLASFASYAVEKKVSKHPDQFGDGAVAGVAGPESANNAAAQTSFIPMLSLGIPSNAIMALMAGAMLIQGIVPGPQVMFQNPSLFWGLIASMWVGNLMLVILNIPLVGIWIRLASVPYSILFPAIMIFCSIGVYSISSNELHVISIALFGLAGYILIKMDFEPAPLILGFVLGPLLEENFRRTMLLSDGDLLVFIKSPISLGLVILSAIVLVIVALPAVRKKREVVFED